MSGMPDNYAWRRANDIVAGHDAVEPGGATVLVFRDKYLTSWPVARRGGWARTITMRELCLRQWGSDVHFCSYLPVAPIGEPPTAKSLGFDATGNRPRKKNGKQQVEHIDDEFTEAVPRRYDNEAVGHFRFELHLWIADVDDPFAHATGKPARADWLALMERKMARVAEKHPRVFSFTTRGGVRLVFQRETPFVIETEEDKDRYRLDEYPRFARYIGHEFDIRVDPNCANYSRLFRAPLVRRKVGDAWEDQKSKFIGDPSTLEVL